MEFLCAIVITHIASFIFIYLGGEKQRSRIGVREMSPLTTGVWILASLFGAPPFVLIEHISYSDAFFETMSGITTTGSTVLHGLDTMHSTPAFYCGVQFYNG